jgi:hypothetical protein
MTGDEFLIDPPAGPIEESPLYRLGNQLENLYSQENRSGAEVDTKVEFLHGDIENEAILDRVFCSTLTAADSTTNISQLGRDYCAYEAQLCGRLEVDADCEFDTDFTNLLIKKAEGSTWSNFSSKAASACHTRTLVVTK